MNKTQGKKNSAVMAASIEESLKQHAFFAGLDPELVRTISLFGTRESFAENILIFRRGESADKFYLVETGLVSVGINPRLHSPVNIQTVTDNEVLGWSWLVPPYVWQFDGRTLEPTTAIVLDANKLRQLFETRTDIGYEISRRVLQMVGRRLQATRIQFWDIYRMHYMLEKDIP